MAVTRQLVQQELVQLFPGIQLDPLYDSIVEVGRMLGKGMASGLFVNGLQELERRLQAALEKRLRPWNPLAARPDMPTALTSARNYWQDRVNGVAAKNETYNHLLTDELTRLEGQAGFSFNVGFLKPNKAQLYVSVVDAADFRNQLALGRHWKDPGVPGAHGEFTHRIQWYVVIASGILPPGVPVQVFKRCAAWVSPLMPAVNGASEVDLWQTLCDRDRFNGGQSIAVRADSVNDFRCPEHLGEYLANTIDPATYPLLHGFLSARAQKRAGFDPTEYVAKKMFHRPYGSLSQDQKHSVLGVMGNRDLLAMSKYGQPYASLALLERQWVDGRMGRGILRFG